MFCKGEYHDRQCQMSYLNQQKKTHDEVTIIDMSFNTVGDFCKCKHGEMFGSNKNKLIFNQNAIFFEKWKKLDTYKPFKYLIETGK